MEKTLILESDYQIKSTPIPIVSRIHAMIDSLGIPIDPKDFIYKPLEASSLEDCFELENEWFPGQHVSPGYYQSLTKSNYFTICCYWSPKGISEEYLLGVILVKMQRNNKCLSYLKDRKFCAKQTEAELEKNLNDNRDKGIAHICSIGVIDEARRLGIGKRLIEEAELYAMRMYENCIGLCLEVIETGKRAIGLYRKVGFTELYTKSDYYNIGGTLYNAIVFAKTC